MSWGYAVLIRNDPVRNELEGFFVVITMIETHRCSCRRLRWSIAGSRYAACRKTSGEVYRISAPTTRTRVVERNQVGTLFAVACRLRRICKEKDIWGEALSDATGANRLRDAT